MYGKLHLDPRAEIKEDYHYEMIGRSLGVGIRDYRIISNIERQKGTFSSIFWGKNVINEEKEKSANSNFGNIARTS